VGSGKDKIPLLEYIFKVILSYISDSMTNQKITAIKIDYSELLKIYKSYIGPERIFEINKILKELDKIDKSNQKVSKKTVTFTSPSY
jgi:hypothetical protein